MDVIRADDIIRCRRLDPSAVSGTVWPVLDSQQVLHDHDITSEAWALERCCLPMASADFCLADTDWGVTRGDIPLALSHQTKAPSHQIISMPGYILPRIRMWLVGWEIRPSLWKISSQLNITVQNCYTCGVLLSGLTYLTCKSYLSSKQSESDLWILWRSTLYKNKKGQLKGWPTGNH